MKFNKKKHQVIILYVPIIYNPFFRNTQKSVPAGTLYCSPALKKNLKSTRVHDGMGVEGWFGVAAVVQICYWRGWIG